MSSEPTIQTRLRELVRRDPGSELQTPRAAPHAWHGNQLDARVSREAVVRAPERAGKVASPRAPSKVPVGSVLSTGEFDRCLARERSLADRGTRQFSLLVLRHVDGTGDGCSRLARSLRERLRSTDLVGHLDAHRVAVLLSETQPDGAQVVASWVDLIVVELGLRVEPTIYVYPSPAGPLRVAQAEESGRAKGESNGHSNGHANGQSRARANGHVATDCRAPAEVDEGRCAADWPVADLSAELSVAMPFWKRFLDVFALLLALPVLLPVFIAVAIAIKLDSPGPVIFKQMRAGRGARPFAFYKFRSMFADAERRRTELEALNEQDGPIFKIHDDPRITRVGRLLRRWSIDELPQVWNVLMGDITLVGPRSPMLNEVAAYEPWQRRRLNVMGGVTCIWQVSGRSQISFHEWMRMDMQYVQRSCLKLDLWLLARTVPAVLFGRGAY
jgi:lipopolysaccharide/colanic/teichoic acid biosynthesis glycosyltransferase